MLFQPTIRLYLSCSGRCSALARSCLGACPRVIRRWADLAKHGFHVVGEIWIGRRRASEKAQRLVQWSPPPRGWRAGGQCRRGAR